jgi:hypothetical protein
MTADKSLHDAYIQTIYRVIGTTQPVDIRIGYCSAALDQILQHNGVSEWAFVTASNPRSRRLPDRDNARRNAEMNQFLQQAGWRTLAAIGVPCNSRWQPEDSVLILGIDRDAATKLALRWEQNAFVHGKIGQPAELVWVI